MAREADYESMGAFEHMMEGLKQSLSQVRGELTLRTTTLAAPAPKFSARRVAAIRKKTGMSQAVFASYLNVPVRTLQSWEQGAREPKAGEARLLQIFEQDPSAIGSLVLGVSRGNRPARRSKARTKRKPAA